MDSTLIPKQDAVYATLGGLRRDHQPNRHRSHLASKLLRVLAAQVLNHQVPKALQQVQKVIHQVQKALHQVPKIQAQKPTAQVYHLNRHQKALAALKVHHPVNLQIAI